MNWISFGLAAAAGVASSEMGKVGLTNQYKGTMADTTLKEVVGAGVVAVYRIFSAETQTDTSAGGVPWFVVFLIAALKVQHSLWRGQCLQLAPNAGIAKNVINLNGPLAMVCGYALFSQELTIRMVLGSTIVVLGSYISTSSPQKKEKLQRNAGASWVMYGLMGAAGIVTCEVGKVALTNYYGGEMKDTTLKVLVAAGLIAIFRFFMRPKQQELKDKPKPGEVPWWMMFALAAWKVQHNIWRDKCMQMAPNAGIAKNVINLNGPFATLSAYLIFRQILNFRMVAGSALVVAGSYISTT